MKKNNQKGKVKLLIAVIPATLAAIAAIWTAYINISQKTTSSEDQNLSMESKTRKVDLADNSGTIVNGDNNTVSVSNDSDTKKEEMVTLTGEMLGYFQGGIVDNENILKYSDDGYEPIYDFHLLNENGVTIDIQNIFIEVTDYKDFSEFILENPAGGADLLDIIYWQCNISPEKRRYHVALTGTDENNTEDLSGTQYVSIKASDSGEFYLKIFPDTPGLYEAKIIVEYTSYEGKTEEITSDNIKFIYDPNYEVITEFNGVIYYP